MTYQKLFYKNQAKSIIKEFKKRKIDGYYCENKTEALKKSLELLKTNSSISWGGSMTLEEIGLLDALKEGDYKLIDRNLAKSSNEKEDLMRKAFFADYYFTSTNALTLDGKLVNIDGNGNRVAAISYGPKNIIVVAGINKVVKDIDDAFNRIRNQASPPNSLRLDLDTPCKQLGYCTNCYTDDCICCQFLVTRMSRVPNRIKVILVGEVLGY